LTAQAIAAECGIITNPPHLVKNISALSRDYDGSISEDFDEKKAVQVSSDAKTSIVLSGPELITLNENQWEQLCKYDEIVFARTTPEQKLRIVREFQGRDEIVGMTGDGVVCISFFFPSFPCLTPTSRQIR
jgi:sodium/potassium-transporting ATPase subunit alpha